MVLPIKIINNINYHKGRISAPHLCKVTNFLRIGGLFRHGILQGGYLAKFTMKKRGGLIGHFFREQLKNFEGGYYYDGGINTTFTVYNSNKQFIPNQKN